MNCEGLSGACLANMLDCHALVIGPALRCFTGVVGTCFFFLNQDLNIGRNFRESGASDRGRRRFTHAEFVVTPCYARFEIST